VLLGAIACAVLAAGALRLPSSEFPQQYQDLVAGIGVVVAIVLGLLALLYFLIARKLQKGRQWARVLVLIFAVLGLLGGIGQVVLAIQAGADTPVIAGAASSLIGP